MTLRALHGPRRFEFGDRECRVDVVRRPAAQGNRSHRFVQRWAGNKGATLIHKRPYR
ncbi:MAG: hypothetical protein NVSMB64_05460 [Candidatus Velthaea sp.]